MPNYVVTIEGTYEGGLRCVARHGPSGGTLETDAPRDNQGRGESFSPTDLVATAAATCVCTILGIVAQRRDLDLATMRFRIEKEMVNDPHRRIARLPMTLWLPAALEADDRRALEHAAHTCPVHRSLHPDVEAPIEFVYG